MTPLPEGLPPLPPGTQYAGRLEDYEGPIEGHSLIEGFSWDEEPHGWMGTKKAPGAASGKWHIASPLPGEAQSQEEDEIRKYASELQILCDTIMGAPNVATRFSDVRQQLLDDLSDLSESRKELGRLRAIFPAICAAIGNGACCTPETSIEFLQQIPDEVRRYLSRLRDENRRLNEQKTAWQDGRMEGRREAVSILMQMAPESLDDCVGNAPNGDTGDYSSVWILDKLRAKFDCDERVGAYEKLEAHYWTEKGERSWIEDENRRLREWQPIETAPKDETKVDLWGKDGSYWGKGPNNPKRWPDCYWLEDGGFSKWRNRYGDSINATHWKPLPANPGDKEEGGEA